MLRRGSRSKTTASMRRLNGRRRSDAGRGGADSSGDALLTLNAAGVDTLKDPARMALLLVRACASSALLVEGDTAEPDTTATPATSEPNAEDEVASAEDEGGDEDEDAERLEEENDDDDDDVADDVDDDEDADAHADDEKIASNVDERSGFEELLARTDVEDDLEAIAAALEIAQAIVGQLKVKMLVKAGEQMDGNEDPERSSPISFDGSSIPRSSSTAAPGGSTSAKKVGVPRVRARAISNSHCGSCSKSFNAFHRSRNCEFISYSCCLNVALGFEFANLCDFCASVSRCC